MASGSIQRQHPACLPVQILSDTIPLIWEKKDSLFIYTVNKIALTLQFFPVLFIIIWSSTIPFDHPFHMQKYYFPTVDKAVLCTRILEFISIDYRGGERIIFTFLHIIFILFPKDFLVQVCLCLITLVILCIQA